MLLGDREILVRTDTSRAQCARDATGFGLRALSLEAVGISFGQFSMLENS